MNPSVQDHAALFSRRTSAVVRGVGHSSSVFASRASGAEIWDVEERRYIDFAGGIAVLNTGHCHPKVVAAVEAQLGRFTHTCFQVVLYESYIEVCERLNALGPISGPKKSVLLTTGAEATENAIKIARCATGRSGVIAFTGAFHGRTITAMNMTGKVLPYKKGMGPAQPGIWHVPFPVRQHGVTTEDALRHIQFLFRADVDPKQIAAIIIEPVQGEGGFHEAPAELMRALRAICDEHGIILVADEVQTGFGRTGRMFAMEHFDVEPDLICVAKSLAGGFPLSGVIGRAALMDAPEPGALGGTYAGNPLSCVAALAVLDVFKEENLLRRADEIGMRAKEQLAKFQLRNDVLPIAGIRGRGAMIAFDVVKDSDTAEADASATKRLTAAALERGLILLSCGTELNTIRVLVPLTASDAIVDEGLNIIGEALSVARAAN